jgi:hypothetical protein
MSMWRSKQQLSVVQRSSGSGRVLFVAATSSDSIETHDEDLDQTTALRITINANPGIALSSSSSSSAKVAMPAFYQWLLQSFQRHYDNATLIPCPFFRRRVADALDSVDLLIRFFIIRHKSLDFSLSYQPAAWRCKGDTTPKQIGIAIHDLAQVIRHDWHGGGTTNHNKGYYITGRLSHAIYRDDCYFDGPDPDMPVRGLRKYLNAASQLFDHKRSFAELLNLEIVRRDDDRITAAATTAPSSASSAAYSDYVVVAYWRLNGVLKLPWRPILPELTGRTYYYPDADGLIYRHVEQWDQSVLQAFAGTFWPPIQSQLSQSLRFLSE